MVSDLILGKVDADVACAIALDLVECRRIGVCLEGVTVYDERLQRVGVERDWLAADDPLHLATREYLVAKRTMHQNTPRPGEGGTWAATSAARKRQQAVTQALDAKVRARLLLLERGVLQSARDAGMSVRD